ncbi:hypothetical protein UFVDC4_00064 [Staphylococcus phage vB_SauM-UFV_DC4]|nr:hypothetical protein UFVDC4_00064 [Staphylococcus phage vB_SauM-UFV_DC4]
MGTFISNDELQPKDIVNSYVSSYLSGTEKYSKFQAGAPSFVTYYSKDHEKSTSDRSLDNVEEIIGDNSPLKYNKLKDFPLYNVAEMNPTIEWDEEWGTEKDLESEAVILPGTIEPLPDDFIVFQYQSKENATSRIYRVTNVEMSSLENSAYYKIQYQNFNVNTEDIENQVSNVYRTVFSNIGTDNKSLILEEDFYQVNHSIKYADEFSQIFIDHFYNSSLNTFIYYEDEFSAVASTKYIDLNLSRFIYDNNLLVKSSTYLSNILPYKDKNPKNERINQKNYKFSLYEKLKDKKTLPNVITLNDTKDNFLKMFREKYKEISFVHKSIEDTKVLDGLNDFIELSNLTKINEVNEDYQGTKSLTYFDDRYKLVSMYMNDEKIEEKILSKVFNYYDDKYDMNMEDYVLLPCILFIIKDSIEGTFRK